MIIAVMGGDGSLSQTLKHLRTSEIINTHINKITFCSLPYGTGNDTGQTFGWGGKFKLYVLIYCNLENPGPWAEDIETLMNALIGAYKD